MKKYFSSITMKLHRLCPSACIIGKKLSGNLLFEMIDGNCNKEFTRLDANLYPCCIWQMKIGCQALCIISPLWIVRLLSSKRQPIIYYTGALDVHDCDNLIYLSVNPFYLNQNLSPVVMLHVELPEMVRCQLNCCKRGRRSHFCCPWKSHWEH